jgi:putative transcriptional regulator
MRKVLRDARTAKKIPVAEMARRLNISASFYYKIEQGIRNPTIDLAKAIADILESTIDELFCANDLDSSSRNSKDPAPAEAVNQ